jgi:hypothetical protein
VGIAEGPTGSEHQVVDSTNENSCVVQPGPKIAEVRVDKLAANKVGTVLTIFSCVAGVALAHALPRHAPWVQWHAYALVVSVVVLLPLHEGIHALGLRWFAKVAWADIRFGVMWRVLMPYCGCKVPISVHAYRRMALLPLGVTGMMTVLALLLFPADWLGLLAGIAISTCVGDVWVAVKLARFAGDLFAQDCPSEIGCDVLLAIP